MSTIFVEKINEVHLRVYSDDFGVEQELSEYFKYEVPGAKFTPKFKAKIWDGFIRLYSIRDKTLYIGLLDYLITFAKNNSYNIQYPESLQYIDNISLEEITEFANKLNLHSKGNLIEIRDYQLDAVLHALNYKRCILLSPTGSGKSLILYTLIRWHLEHNRKILLITPSVSLVEQMHSDFQDYSSNNQWSVEDYYQKLYSGFSKEVQTDVLISTWQSIFRQPKEWFDQFDVILGDEAHLYKAKSVTSIMEKMTNVQYRLGTTGSLDNKKINTLSLEGLFGRVYRVTTTNKLQKEGRLAQLKIKALLLKYSDEECKAYNQLEYKDEISFIISNERRNKFICNLALSCNGNTLVMFNYVEKHGKVLYELIKTKSDDRPIYFIHGGVDVEEREQIRKNLANQSNAIVVCSYGTLSTGINIPSIENIIFSSPSKSTIRVLQSLGRGLRLNKGKTHCKLFDLTDDLHWKSKKNHTLKHGAERYQIYMSEQFEIKLIEVNL